MNKEYIKMYNKAKEIQKLWKSPPSQEQLQKLIIKLFTPFGLLKDFYKWCNSDVLDYHQRGNWSMEQLWLAYVMKEKFGKIWNGEEWNV